MYAVERLSSYISRGVDTVSAPFHPFGGAVDIIVVQQQDGSFKSSPWYVKFGKFQGVLKTREKVVNISVNGTEARFHMYLDHKGEAYFLREVDGEEGDDTFSPPWGDETNEQSQSGSLAKAKSLNFDGCQGNSVSQIDMANGKNVKMAYSQPSGILGLVFGRSSGRMGRGHSKGDGGVESTATLKDADTMASILEAECSTNTSDNQKMDNFSALLGIEKPVEVADGDVQVCKMNDLGDASVHCSLDHSIGEPAVPATVGLQHDATDDNFGVGLINAQYSDEITSPMNKCVRTHEQVLSISMPDMSDLSDKQIVSSTQSTSEIREAIGSDNAGSNAIATTSRSTAVDLQGPNFNDAAAAPHDHSSISTQYETGLALDESDSLLVSRLSEGETCEGGVSSFIYSETSVSMSVQNDGLSKEVGVYTEISYEAVAQSSETNAELESDLPLGKENSDGRSHKPNAAQESEGTDSSSMKIVGGSQILTDSLSTLNVSLPSSNPDEFEVVEVIHRDVLLIQGKPLEPGEDNILEGQSQMTEVSSSCLFGNDEVVNKKASSSPDFIDQTVENDSILESRPAGIFSDPGNVIGHIQEGEGVGEGVTKCELLLSSKAFTSPQESNNSSLAENVETYRMESSKNIEEDDYLFSDIDNFVVNGSQLKETASAAVPDDHMTEDNEEERELNCVNNDSCLSSNRSFGSRSYSTAGSYASEFIQESSPTCLGSLPEEFQAQMSPISIPKSRLCKEDVGQLVGSVPNFWNHRHDVENYNGHKHLSRSLDLNSESVDWRKHMKSLKSKTASESNLAEYESRSDPVVAVVNTDYMGPHENLSTNPVVEISLCKHLLFEGMGVDAACRAFDAEKLDVEKFSAMGPSLMKNDKLVVRIGCHYFPWSAAAPIVLGMVTFGQENIFEPEGMIPVDKVEKSTERELSKAISPSSGSWKLWLFSFRKSKDESSVRSTSPNGMNGTNTDNNSSESTGDISGDSSMHEGSTMKKEVRSIIPTSQELASLDLKEGQNEITFTFSTAMLGRQQVDARIYLWKWNTRIVVSDVDGTITKSDVLGQFMPLVGKDWSQTGVAHLFSAIKENGYQLLFLSARAISQAYLTRRFLLNLKQDGKALPDGPVVISPDGLFPSLFREVIRRAPHEFKIACLEDIRALFPPDCNPFYAGFGNRDTDEISYLRVGIPRGKIFIINPKGEVAVNRWVDTKSYASLHSLVNGMFPAMSSAEQEDFNSWNFWKIPLPEIDL